MLNNKGFTIAEVLVSFSLTAMILVTMIGSTVYYRDKLKEEEVKSQLIDFKNSITKIIYDDIVKNKANRVETCLFASNCLNLIGKDDSVHVLKIVEEPVTVGNKRRGVYLSYDGTDYFLPDSDLVGTDDYGNTVRVCDFTNGIRFHYYKELYTVKITLNHMDYNLQYDIILTLNNIPT